MLENKLEAFVKQGDEENGNKIDTSVIELENADISKAMSKLFSEILFDRIYDYSKPINLVKSYKNLYIFVYYLI